MKVQYVPAPYTNRTPDARKASGNLNHCGAESNRPSRNFWNIYPVTLTANRLTRVLFRLTEVLLRPTGVLFSLNYKTVLTADHLVSV